MVLRKSLTATLILAASLSGCTLEHKNSAVGANENDSTDNGQNLPPTVSFIGSLNVQIYKNQSATLQVNASDSDGSVAFVAYVDRNLNKVYGSSTVAPNYAVQIPFSEIGSNTIEAIAFDNDGGQTTTTEAVVVKVVNTPTTPSNVAPTVSLESSGSVSIQAGQSFSFQASASDSDGSVVRVDYKNTATNAVIASSTNASHYPASLAFPTAGVYTIKAVATDNLGAQTTSSASLILTVTAIVINHPPSVSLNSTSATVTVGQAVTAQSTASDSDGNVVKVEYKNATTGSVLATSSSGGTFSAGFSFSTAGTYTVKAVATDNQNAQTTSSNSLVVTVNAVITPPVIGCNVNQIPANKRLRIEHGVDAVNYNNALPGAWDDYICKLIDLRMTTIRFTMKLLTPPNGGTIDLTSIRSRINGNLGSDGKPTADCLAGNSSCSFFGVRQEILAAKRAGMTVYMTYYGADASNKGSIPTPTQTKDSLREADLQLRQVPGDASSPRLYDGITMWNEWCGDARFWDVQCSAWSNGTAETTQMIQQANRYVDNILIPALDVIPANLVYSGATWCDQSGSGHLFKAMMDRLTATIGTRQPPAGFSCHSYIWDPASVKTELLKTKALVDNFKTTMRARFPSYGPRILIPEWGTGGNNYAMSTPSVTNNFLNALIEGGANGIYLYVSDTSWGAEWGLMDVVYTAARQLNFTLIQRYYDYLAALNLQTP